MNKISVSSRVRFKFEHLFETVTCIAAVKRVTDATVSLAFPERVMALPFPPVKRGHWLVVTRDSAEKALVAG